MKAISFLIIIFILSVFFFSGCKKDGDNDDENTSIYLVDFTEYAPVSKPYTTSAVKGYFGGIGLTNVAAMVKYEIKVYKVRYKTALNGDSILASGLIAAPVPEKSSNAFPMMSYQHSTITINNESPTYNPQVNNTAMATYLASLGFIVIIPDYIGYGESSDEFHPFMIKEYTVNAVLDFIRASKEFIQTEKPCKTNGKLYLSGYSEGGSATLAALSAIENDAKNSDLTVTASACGAGIYDLNSFRNWMVSQVKYDQPYLMGYLLESFSRYADLDIDYSLVYSTLYAPLITGMIDGVKTSDQLNDMFETLHVGDLFNDNFEKPDSIFKNDVNYTGLRAALTENSVPVWPLKSNVTLYYGKGDTWVPNEQALKIYFGFTTQGAASNIKIEPLDGLDNKGAEIPTLINAVIWFMTF